MQCPSWAAVKREWGRGPVAIEPVTGRVRIEGEKWRCHSLGPDGARTREVELEADGNWHQTLKLSPDYGTMWYLLER